MIRYECEQCGTKLEVDNSASGKPAECHKCHFVMNVPLPNFLPRVACPNCEHELDNLTDEHAGQIVKCPKCGCAVRAPETAGSGSGCSFTALVCVMLGLGLTWLTIGLIR